MMTALVGGAILGMIYFSELAAKFRPLSEWVAAEKEKAASVAFARENREKYKREGHEVKYVELKDVGHMWGTMTDINETIWKFFADHLLRGKYEPSSGNQR
jgi:hypothetical protein